MSSTLPFLIFHFVLVLNHPIYIYLHARLLRFSATSGLAQSSWRIHRTDVTAYRPDASAFPVSACVPSFTLPLILSVVSLSLSVSLNVRRRNPFYSSLPVAFPVSRPRRACPFRRCHRRRRSTLRKGFKRKPDRRALWNEENHSDMGETCAAWDLESFPRRDLFF